MESPTRRRTHESRPSTDAGLAEWTSKIKALQRDVDADEELEQRRLEDEIRASRLARSRRSGGMQFAGRVPLSTSPDENASSPTDALRKLTGEPATAPPFAGKPSTSDNNTNTKPEPISLAAFIGGRATGPRLNRPAPQPNAHDPTAFEQRTRADIVAPHPVFGSGGVALVGLAGKGRKVVAEPRTPERSAPAREEVRNMNPATTMTASAATITSPASNGGNSASKRKSWVRERTVSSPSPYLPAKPVEKTRSPPPVIPVGSPGVKGRVESLYANANRSSERVTSPPVLHGSKSTDKMAQRPTAPAKPEALRKVQPVIETPPRTTTAALSASTSTPPLRTQTPGSSTPTKPTSVSPSVSVPSLARPIQPHQRPLSTGPHIPLSKSPAPAFLKPPHQKDLTPSLSRLQGRGFVQSFVKLSGEIEAAASGSPERAADSMSPKKGSVLDRWNPPSPSPRSSISAPPLRKAKTFDFTRTPQAEVTASPAPVPKSVPAPESVRPTPQPKPSSLVSSAKSAPTKTKNVPAPGDVLPVGSSNTLISYIKQTKTGDAPPTDVGEAPHQRSKTPSRHADENTSGTDELGVRPRSRNSNASSSAPSAPVKATSRAKSDLASSVTSGRPLSHPTKDRAKLRRRGAGGQALSKSDEHEDAPDERSMPSSTPAYEVAKHTTSPNEVVTSSISKAGASHLLPAISQSQELSAAQPVQTHGNNIRRLQDTWANQAPIGVKPLRKPPLVSPSPTRTSFGTPLSQGVSTARKQPLPGLVLPDVGAVPPPSPPLTPPVTPPISMSARQERAKPPSSPMRNSRIPTTGIRATVMDVAQALNASGASPVSPITPKSQFRLSSPVSRNAAGELERERDPGRWSEAENERTITPASIKAERRRSNYDKYASFTLPVLPEEKTPVSSPAGTLKGVDVATLNASSSGVGAANQRESELRGLEKPVPPKKPEFARAPSKIHIDVVDEPVPAISASKMWDVGPIRFVPDADVHTISVEVLNVAGGSATEVSRDEGNGFIFYDTETLAIVHRAKSRSSGLVSTKVWAWSGQQAELGEREDRKIQELAKRYGTAVMKCGQCAEPQELVHILGGSLIIRQGQRSLWSAENTTMHMVRSLAGLILIDEVDLNCKNLCSGFSYCISLLDTLWVWYGCGSVPAERNAALRYAQSLRSSGQEKTVVEVDEGEEDEMFWMFLGEDGYASANYWKWRKNEKGIDPRFWRVECANAGSEVKELETFPSSSEFSKSVLVVHLAYEIFALVGSAVRGQRRNIKLGLTLAQELSAHTARSKPFRPPVHVLIFPSQIPLDLRAAVRGLDVEAIHDSEDIPDHMNLVTLDEAWTQLNQKEWDKKDLEDAMMMPLGFSPR